MSLIKVSVVSSNEEIFSGEAKMVYATGTLGELGIAPGHTPLLTGLAPGPVRLETEKEELTFFCSGGFIEVQPNEVTFLSYMLSLSNIILYNVEYFANIYYFSDFLSFFLIT